MKHYILKQISFCLLLIPSLCFAQEIILPTFPTDTFSQLKVQLEQSKYHNSYYLQLEFSSLPNSYQLKRLKGLGVELLAYTGNHSFYAAIPSKLKKWQLKDLNIQSIQTIPLAQRSSITDPYTNSFSA